jgi:hypothetical protein
VENVGTLSAMNVNGLLTMNDTTFDPC